MVKNIKHNFEILKVGKEIIATSSTFFFTGQYFDLSLHLLNCH